jgi:NAD(P)-dependent dehydrogenase (short-subunit alcohol dehydrogenase family)
LNLPLDCLINNAGLMSHERILTKDGFEMTFMANHLGHFLLTLLLIPSLQQSQGRILNLTSCLHKLVTRFQFEDNMTFPSNYEMFRVYAQSKLCNILFTKALANRLNNHEQFSSIRVYAIHPGCVQTEVTRGMNWFFRTAYQLAGPTILGLFLKTAEQGAAGIVQVAIDPSLSSREWNGEYFFHAQRSPVTDLAKNREVAERLWQISEQWAGIRWDEVSTNKS